MISRAYLTDTIKNLTGKTLVDYTVIKTLVDRTNSYILIKTELEENEDSVDFIVMSSVEGAMIFVAGPEHYEMFDAAENLPD